MGDFMSRSLLKIFTISAFLVVGGMTQAKEAVEMTIPEIDKTLPLVHKQLELESEQVRLTVARRVHLEEEEKLKKLLDANARKRRNKIIAGTFILGAVAAVLWFAPHAGASAGSMR